MSLNTWGRLVPLCATVHRLLYVLHDKDAARAYVPQLKALVEELPEDDGSIIGAEAYALFHELSGNLMLAISFRRQEISLMEQLYNHIATHDYDVDTRQALLAGRGKRVFHFRTKILARLLLSVAQITIALPYNKA